MCQRFRLLLYVAFLTVLVRAAKADYFSQSINSETESDLTTSSLDDLSQLSSLVNGANTTACASPQVPTPPSAIAPTPINGSNTTASASPQVPTPPSAIASTPITTTSAPNCLAFQFPPFLTLTSTDGIFGKWYLLEQYGVENATVCETVQFYPGETNLTFFKSLKTVLNNGSIVSNYQNGTITSPGKVTLDYTYPNRTMYNPRFTINYTIIGYKSDEYMIVFYCKLNATVPQIPVLVRSLNPPQSMWAEVFSIIEGAGLNFAWLDLMCRAPVANGTAIVTNEQDVLNRKYIPYLTKVPNLTTYERAVLTQHILKPYAGRKTRQRPYGCY